MLHLATVFTDFMKWITREKVKVDRAACPWLIKELGFAGVFRLDRLLFLRY
jgi:chromate resistance exported protein